MANQLQSVHFLLTLKNIKREVENMIKLTIATIATLATLTSGALAQSVDCQQMAVQTSQGLTTHVCLAPTQLTQNQTISPEQAAFMERYKNWDKNRERAINFSSMRTIHNPDGSIHSVQVVPRVTTHQK